MVFNDILLKGILSKNGMANFSNSLSEADVEAIHQYLLKKQVEVYTKEQASKK
jgi:quinohemoprotein ethanol dehydrogenase